MCIYLFIKNLSCIADIYSKHALGAPLKYKKRKTIEKTFEIVLKSNIKQKTPRLTKVKSLYRYN